MATRVQTGIARHAARLMRQDGRPVTYMRGGVALFSDELAVPVEDTYRVQDGEGGFTVMTSTDWIIERAFFGNTEPRRGDVIQTPDGNDDVQEFEVMPVDDGPVAKRYDTNSKLLLIHSNLLTS